MSSGNNTATISDTQRNYFERDYSELSVIFDQKSCMKLWKFFSGKIEITKEDEIEYQKIRKIRGNLEFLNLIKSPMILERIIDKRRLAEIKNALNYLAKKRNW